MDYDLEDKKPELNTDTKDLFEITATSKIMSYYDGIKDYGTVPLLKEFDSKKKNDSSPISTDNLYQLLVIAKLAWDRNKNRSIFSKIFNAKSYAERFTYKEIEKSVYSLGLNKKDMNQLYLYNGIIKSVSKLEIKAKCIRVIREYSSEAICNKLAFIFDKGDESDLLIEQKIAVEKSKKNSSDLTIEEKNSLESADRVLGGNDVNIINLTLTKNLIDEIKNAKEFVSENEQEAYMLDESMDVIRKELTNKGVRYNLQEMLISSGDNKIDIISKIYEEETEKRNSNA